MAKTNNLKDFLTDLADGIRAKKGTTEPINPQDFRSEIDSGGVVEKCVNFWDYDGTLLYSYSMEEAKALTELPPLPTHDEQNVFYASEWSESLEEVHKNYFYLEVHPIYKPVDTQYSYCSLFCVEINYDGMALELGCWSDGSSANRLIDWGDGSVTSEFSTSYSTHPKHTYSERGKFTIAIMTSRTLSINIGYDYQHKFITTSNAYRVALLSCYCDTGLNLKSQAFANFYNIKMAINRTANDGYTFQSSSLNHLIVEGTMSTLSHNSIRGCKRVMMLNATAENEFQYAYDIRVLLYGSSSSLTATPPNLKTLILTSSSKVSLGSSVTKESGLGTRAFVPDELVESYKADSYWKSTFGTSIFPISSITEEDVMV